MAYPQFKKSMTIMTGPRPNLKLGMMVALGGAIGAAGLVLIKALSRGRIADKGHAAAFAPDETDKDNFDQTRHAGTDAMRDTPPKWDALDEQLDASFPSSDPPSYNPGIA